MYKAYMYTYLDLNLKVEVSGIVEPYDAGNREQPPDGGYCIDIEVWLINEDNKRVNISDFISDEVFEKLSNQLYEQWEFNEKGSEV